MERGSGKEEGLRTEGRRMLWEGEGRSEGLGKWKGKWKGGKERKKRNLSLYETQKREAD